MQASNSIVGKKKSFSAIINSPNYRATIEKTIGDPQRTAQFISTLTEAAKSNPSLAECETGTIITAALRGEVGMGLSYALNDYAIIPYNSRNGKVAQFQLQVNGLKRLAIRSGQYKKIRLKEVRQGEFLGFDEDGDPKIVWNQNADAREYLPIVGYYGSYTLMNGFFQSIYWTHDQILKHAERYSKTFAREGGVETYHKLVNGELKPEQVQKLRNGSPWFDYPDSVPHQKMCLKTIAKQLFNDGLAPKEIFQAIQLDNLQESSQEPVNIDDKFSQAFSDKATDNQQKATKNPVGVVDIETGEVTPISAEKAPDGEFSANDDEIDQLFFGDEEE